MSRLAPLLESIPLIKGRVYGAARLANIMQAGTLTQVCPAAFTLPLGIGGGKADAMSGFYTQSIDRLDGVLLVVRHAGDASGGAALEQLEPLVEDVIAAIVGQGPEGMPGVYVLRKGELTGMQAGALQYQLDFAIEDQLRIA